MSRIKLAGGWAVAFGIIIVFVARAVAANAGQSAGPDTALLRDLIAEVHQVRLAVEESSRVQTQSQSLSVALTVQQSRIVQVAARHDGARRDLDAAEVRTRGAAADLRNTEEALRKATGPERAHYEQFSAGLKRELDEATVREGELRQRESNLARSLEQEESKWAELVARLEQLVKK